MARALGIDYGLKRSGLSVTDPLRISVNAMKTVQTIDLWSFIQNYIVREQVDLIVLGDPYHIDGTPTELHLLIHTLGRKIADSYPAIKVDYQNERLTSKEAVNLLVKKGIPKQKRDREAIDQMSAVLILQKYLNHY